jgi:hypothetical protein
MKINAIFLLFTAAVLSSCSRSDYTGTMSELKPTRSGVIIDVDGRYPDQKMTFYVPRATEARWITVHKGWPLPGTTVTAKGPVISYKGHPEIVIDDPAQLTW